MFKGVHFNETYTATPSQDSARILQALCVHLQLRRKAWDISQAYCWADLPPGELIALRYPEGFRKFHNGEETFIVMRKNLYEHNTITLTITKRYTKRDKLNPYVYEQLCDYARYFCRYTSCD